MGPNAGNRTSWKNWHHLLRQQAGRGHCAWVWGLEFGCIGLRVQGLGFGVIFQDSGHQRLEYRFWICIVGLRILGLVLRSWLWKAPEYSWRIAAFRRNLAHVVLEGP